MPSNSAPWLMAAKSRPLKVAPAPYTSAKDTQVVIKVGAVAINPVDWFIQDEDPLFSNIKYPTILGDDVAGEIAEVGASAASQFRIGDRVLGCSMSVMGGTAEGAFQRYVVINSNIVSHKPSSMSYEYAAVFPLCFSVAAAGLFQTDFLNLQYPSEPAQKSTGLPLVIWGGSTGVGCDAIQLAVAAGYEVITTASPKNFEYVRNLGASHAFDYNSPDAVADIIGVLKGKNHAGAVAIGNVGATGNNTLPVDACRKIVAQCPGKKLIASAAQVSREVQDGVEARFIIGNALTNTYVSEALFHHFLPKALAAGFFKIAPKPLIVSKGLDGIQEGLDRLRSGVSAQKVVVPLE